MERGSEECRGDVVARPSCCMLGFGSERVADVRGMEVRKAGLYGSSKLSDDSKGRPISVDKNKASGSTEVDRECGEFMVSLGDCRASCWPWQS